MTGLKSVDVELNAAELVKLLAWVNSESALLPRLNAAIQRNRIHPFRVAFFSFVGTEGEALELLELARVRAPSAVPGITEGLARARAGA